MKTVKNKKQKGRMYEKFLMFILPFLITMAAIFVISLISVALDLEKHLNFPVIAATIGFCAFISAFLCANKKRENGLITGIICNLPSAAIFLLLSLILNGFSADLNLLLILITTLISSALGGIVGVNRKQKAKRGLR